MKIGIIIYGLTTKGGTQRQALCLARALMTDGHEVTLYTFVYNREKCFTDLLEGIPVVALSERYPKWDKQLPHPWGLFTRPSIFADYARKLQGARMLAHLIDPHTDFLNPHGNVSYRVCRYVKKEIAPIPSIWMLNTMPLQSWEAQRRESVDPTFHASFMKRIVYGIMDWIEIKKFISCLDEIMVLSNHVGDLVLNMIHREAHVIRSGVDIKKFSYHPRAWPSDRNVNILAVSIMSPHRRFEDVIEAIDMVHQNGYSVSLSIVGDGRANMPYYEKLQGIVATRRLNDVVEFLGRVSDNELIDHYQNDDIFLFCNHQNAWGLVVFEAMACGIPVIVSRSCGASEVLTHGDNALLVAAKDPKDIALAIQTLIDNKVLYEKLSSTGRDFVEKNITWQRYAQELVAIAKNAI